MTGQVAEAVPTGNTYDKYGSTNPVVRRLMAGFEADLDSLASIASPTSLLDVGCGEGVLTARLAQRLQPQRVVGVDLDDPALRAEWARRSMPNLSFQAVSPGPLPFDDSEFDAACALEVLEHVPDPSLTLSEMLRVAERWVLVSVPREPLWRALNMLRGAYVRDLGNTPGHLNHWSKRAFVRFVSEHGGVEEVRSPFPWTMLLVRAG